MNRIIQLTNPKWFVHETDLILTQSLTQDTKKSNSLKNDGSEKPFTFGQANAFLRSFIHAKLFFSTYFPLIHFIA